MEKVIRPSEKGAIVIEFLQGAEGALTGAEIAEATGLNPQGIHGVLNGLVKNGFVEKGDKVTLTVQNKQGLNEERAYVTYLLTEAGAEYIVE